MKKPAPRRRAAGAKTGNSVKTVAEYLSRVPEPARSTLNRVRAAIRSVVPADSMEILSYGIPAFKSKKVLIWYAAFSNHCSLFPTASVIEMFKDELADYRISKGTIHFPTDKPLPATLVKKMVRARLADIEGKRKSGQIAKGN